MTRNCAVVAIVWLAPELAISNGASVLAQDTSARDLVIRFCQLDAQGQQLIPGGREKVKALFSNSGEPNLERILVIHSFEVSRPFPEKDKVLFDPGYRPLGVIELPQLTFFPLPLTIRSKADFSVVKNISGEMRIEGPVPPPAVKVDVAIRYVTQLRENSKDPVVRQNAEKTLATLKALH